MGQRTGLVHIYYGDGKGKTTTGMGLCVRAAGYGLRVLIYQFMKSNDSSERSILSQVNNITLWEGLTEEKFSFMMSEEEKEERRAFYKKQFEKIISIVREEKYQVLFLDEVIYTIRAGLFDENILIEFLKNKPRELEVILTGNTPDQDLLDQADYVSEIRKVKHPFDQGIGAREGIER